MDTAETIKIVKDEADTKVNAEVRKTAQIEPVGLYGIPPGNVTILYDHAAQIRIELFGGKCPEVVLSFDRRNAKNLGHYVPCRNGLGLRWNVNLNPVNLGRPLARILATLTHEMVHAWQKEHGRPGKGNYHNAQLIEKCAELGIPTDTQGHDLGIAADGLFDKYCIRHNVPSAGHFIEGKELPKPKGSPLKKWTCECGVNVRVAVADFDATCNACGADFHRED